MRPNPRFLIFLLVAAVALALPGAANAAAIKFLTGSYTADVTASAPMGLSPASGASLPYPTSTIRLSWLPVAGTTTYQVQIARQLSDGASCSASTAFQVDNVVVLATSKGTEWVPTLADVANGGNLWTGTYCWRVRSFDASPGLWSSGSKFTRTWTSVPGGLRFYNDHDGAIPRVGTEADFATGSTMTRNTGYATWSAVAGAASYSMEIGTSQSFSPSSIVASRDNIRDTRALILHLPDDTYFWRVRAIAPNGTEGGWSTGSNAFTVQWYDATWSSAANMYPPAAATKSEMRIGWTSMPGASYYEYQIGTRSGCFWDSSNAIAIPDAYGDWVNSPAVYQDPPPATGPPILEKTADPKSSQCRLSKSGATTMNNWVTLKDAWDDKVFDNISHDCYDDTAHTVTCEPAGIPDSTLDDWGATFHGTGEGSGPPPGVTDDGRYGEKYSIYWRVRPVYKLSPDTETVWDVNEDTTVYGTWSSAKSFDLAPGTRVNAQTGTRCDDGNGGTGCLVHVGSTMSALDAPGVADASTMQVPALTWSPFAGAGGYLIQIARDPLFNNMAKQVYQPAEHSLGYGFQQSYALTDGLADNSEGTGYWWRVIPCASEFDPIQGLTPCTNLYSESSAGTPTGVGIPSEQYADMAVAQTFVKRTTMQTQVVPNFEGATPLIKWTIDGVPTSDFAAWSRGVGGAEYYQFDLARDPFFSSGLVSLSTTMPRIVPVKPSSGAGSTSELDDGLWYYRVRAVDRNGLQGSWSATASFNKRISGPSQSISGGGPTTGAGVTIAWDPIVGASDYTVQWTTDETFESTPSEATTRQTSFRIDNTKPGVYYWRVRANVNGVAGQWSASTTPVTVTSTTRLDYALSKPVTKANDKLVLYGKLVQAGVATSGKSILLQRKSVGCDANGSYTKIASAVSGLGNDDGVVSFTQPIRSNGCYRFAYVDGAVVYYSVPIAVHATPVVSYRMLNTRVSRGKSYCLQIASNVSVTGRLRLQYKSGGAWLTSKTVNVAAMRGRRQCAAIAKAGNFPTRIVLDNMVSGTSGNLWKSFDTTIVNGGTIRVNDRFTIKR